jgi:nucleoside-diphosphate-sugar epimerase
MRREEVLHVARAAAQVAGVRRVLVIGSQAVVGMHHEDELPDHPAICT